jgi:hypothetical protein
MLVLKPLHGKSWIVWKGDAWLFGSHSRQKAREQTQNRTYPDLQSLSQFKKPPARFPSWPW